MQVRLREAHSAAKQLFLPENNQGGGRGGAVAGVGGGGAGGASVTRHTFGFDFLDDDFFLSF